MLFYIFPSIYILDIIFICAIVCPVVWRRQLASTLDRLSAKEKRTFCISCFFPSFFVGSAAVSCVCECVEHDESVNFRKILCKNVTGFQQLPAAGPNNERQHQRTCDLIALPMQCVCVCVLSWCPLLSCMNELIRSQSIICYFLFHI